MNRVVFSVVSALLLAACTQDGPLTYRLDMDSENDERREMLVEQSKRVIERRLEGMKSPARSIEASTADGVAMLTIDHENPAALSALTEQLQRPFTFDVMGQTQSGETVDVTVDQHGNFTRSELNQDDVDWVEGSVIPGERTAAVHITFKEEGRKELEALFAKMEGKFIGIFVRDQLISKVQVQPGGGKVEDIVINGVPNAELAEIFADDTNVGVHVTFTPVP